jgi:WD40 repeat protein
MKNNNESKKLNNSKEINDIIPGEIIEKRKVSKSQNLSIQYKCIKSIKPYKVEITCILFLKSANIILTSSLDPEIETWSFNSEDSNLKLLTILEGHSMSVINLKEFQNLNCVASCSKDNTLKLWNIFKKICLKTFYYSSGSILTCCYNPKYNMEIYTAGTMEEIMVWGGAAFPLNYNYMPKFKFFGCKKGIKIIDFIDDCDIIVCCGKDEILKFFDWNNNYACVEEIDLGSNIKNAKYIKKRLIVSCDDGNIHFINMNVLKLEKSVQFGKITIWDFQVIFNERYLLIGCSDSNIRLWEIGTNNRAIFKGHNKDVIGVGVIDLDNNYIISASKDLTLKIWKKEETSK